MLMVRYSEYEDGSLLWLSCKAAIFMQRHRTLYKVQYRQPIPQPAVNNFHHPIRHLTLFPSIYNGLRMHWIRDIRCG